MKTFLVLLQLLIFAMLPSWVYAEATYDVIVVGAGISGLAAADALQQMDYKVLVLEGRDRIGGRIFTDHVDGTAIDLGASWIQGVDKNPIAELAAKLHLDLRVTDVDANVYTHTGELLNANQMESLWDLGSRFSKGVSHYQDTSDTDIPLGSLADHFIQKEHLSAQDIMKFKYVTGSVIELEYAAKLNELSALYYDQDEGFSGDEVIFVKGYVQIPDYLAKSLNIQLNQIVTEINYAGDLVNVKTNAKSYKAHAVICTLPLGVLKSNTIKFMPALPAAKLQAIQRLAMGTLNKVVLVFDHVFWDKDKSWIGYMPKQGDRWIDFFNLYRYIKKPILIGFNTGPTAIDMEQWSDEAIIKSAMDTLKIIYGKDIPMPIDYKIARWAHDRFSYGSYSHIPVGATGEDYNILSQPVAGKLFFAGEATSQVYPSTVHGAYLSGLRAAKQIKQASH